MDLNVDSLKVLMLIGRNGPLSRRHISHDLSFTPSRVTRLTDRLLQNGLIHEKGWEESTGGRRSVLLDLREANHLLCGVLLSYTSVLQVVLMDLRANIIQEEKRTLPHSSKPEEVAQEICNSLNRIFKEDESVRGKLIGIGMGAAGLVDPKTGVIHNSPGFPRCKEARLADMVSDRLQIPTYLENEVALSTLAEMWFGKGRGCANFLFLNLGPGIRMGIVINGGLYRGVTGNAGELGHITYDEKGPFCHCGNAGCLEAFVSPEALLSQARASITSHSTSLIAEKAVQEDFALEDIYWAARERDHLAMNLLQRFFEPLGKTLANVVNLFDTEKIIISGSFAKAKEVIVDTISQEIKRRSLPFLSQNIALELSEMDQFSTAIGGGALALQKLCDGKNSLKT